MRPLGRPPRSSPPVFLLKDKNTATAHRIREASRPAPSVFPAGVFECVSVSLRGAQRRGNPIHRSACYVSGIATPVCGLVRNDRWGECGGGCTRRAGSSRPTVRNDIFLVCRLGRECYRLCRGTCIERPVFVRYNYDTFLAEPGGGGRVDRDKKRISSPCPLFACRVCRTKTGWPHQRWCALAELTAPECADCRYWSEAESRCHHPTLRKGGAAP